MRMKLMVDPPQNFAAWVASMKGGPMEPDSTSLAGQGKRLFASSDCIACHTIGHGDNIGPDLMGITRNRERQWLVQMIQNPNQLLDAHDPIASVLLKKYKGIRMPSGLVGDIDVNYILSYLESQSEPQGK